MHIIETQYLFNADIHIADKTKQAMRETLFLQ